MSASDDIDDSAAPLIEHLAELRTRLIHSVIAFIIGMVICFTEWNPIFNFLTNPLCSAMAERGQEDCGLILIKLQEGFFVAISISLLGGLVLGFPYISYQLWRFVAPGLYKNEKGAFLGFQQAGTLVGEGTDNAGGIAAIAFQGSAQEYLSLTIKFIVAFGLCFQLPVLLTLMGKAGLVSAEGLGNVRKYAVVGILVLAALVTPPDVITQGILFVVVYGLYEISIFLVGRVERKREEQLRADGYYDDEYDDPILAEFEEDEDDLK